MDRIKRSAGKLVIPDHAVWELETVASMPFGAAHDYGIIDGLNTDSVRAKLRELLRLGYVDCATFGTPELRSERRWWASPLGYRALEEDTDDADARSLIREDLAGLGIMAKRPDVAAVIIRLVARFVPFVIGSRAVDFTFFSSGPLDCLVSFSEHRFVGIIYAGPGLRRPSVWRRLKELKELPRASLYCVLVLTPTTFDRTIVLAQLANLELNGATAVTYAALGGYPRCWLAPDVDGWLSHKDIGDGRLMSWTFTQDGSPVTISDLGLSLPQERKTEVRNVDKAPALNLRPLAKRLINMLANWPILARDSAIAMLQVSPSQFSDLLKSLRMLDFVTTLEISGVIYYTLSSEGISYISSRDRCDHAAMLDTLSVERMWRVPAESPLKYDIASYRGRYIRSILNNLYHNDLVHETIGYLSVALRKDSTWRVTDLIPPRRARMAITPGQRLSTLQSELRGWRVRKTDRSDITKDRAITFYPDGIVTVSRNHEFRSVLLEVELSAKTAREWQDRLEAYALYSLVRPETDLVLVVVGSSTSEAVALDVQTAWVQANPGRIWPVATTTVDLIHAKGITGPIWRVDARKTERLSIIPSPDTASEPLSVVPGGLQ